MINQKLNNISKYELLEMKLGNITFNRFINDLNINPDAIKNVNINPDIETVPTFVNNMQVGTESNALRSFRMIITVNYLRTIISKKFDTSLLKKLSKHSKKYNIKYESTHTENNGDQYHAFHFSPIIKQKYPLPRNVPLVSVETIRDIVGIPKFDGDYSNYSYISNKVCNNGWQYIYHLSEYHQSINLDRIIMKLEASNILKQYYVKAFLDVDENLRIIISKKSKFWKNLYIDDIPIINDDHIRNILGCNRDSISSMYVVKVESSSNEKYRIIFPNGCGRDLESSEAILKRLKKFLGGYFNIILISDSTICFPNQFYIKMVEKSASDVLKTIKLIDDSSEGLLRQMHDINNLVELLAVQMQLLKIMIGNNLTIKDVSKNTGLSETNLKNFMDSHWLQLSDYKILKEFCTKHLK